MSNQKIVTKIDQMMDKWNEKKKIIFVYQFQDINKLAGHNCLAVKMDVILYIFILHAIVLEFQGAQLSH